MLCVQYLDEPINELFWGMLLLISVWVFSVLEVNYMYLVILPYFIFLRTHFQVISYFHRSTHSPLTYVQRPWIDLIKLRYSFSIHAWLPLCVAIWIALSRTFWKEDASVADWLFTRLSSMWLLPCFNTDQSRPSCISSRNVGMKMHISKEK